jgi:hypothetical protein
MYLFITSDCALIVMEKTKELVFVWLFLNSEKVIFPAVRNVSQFLDFITHEITQCLNTDNETTGNI